MITSIITGFFGVSAIACALLIAVAAGQHAEKYRPTLQRHDDLQWTIGFMVGSMIFAGAGVILLLLRS